MTPSKIEPATYRLKAQFFNQLRHRVPSKVVVINLMVFPGGHQSKY